MHTLRKSFLVLALPLLLGATQGCGSGTAGNPQAIISQLDALIAAAVADPKVPGLIMGVWAPAKGIAYAKAVGAADLATGRSMQTTDKVRIASITKTFTTTIILMLADEGLLNLDDTLDRYDFGVAIPKADEITIRMLANNTSGLYDYVTDTDFQAMVLADPLRTWTNRELVEFAMARQDPDFTPGAVWGYSNTNFILQQMIVELITGSTLGEEIQTRIFDALGMTNSSYPTGPTISGEYAHGYIEGDGGELEDSTEMDPSFAGGAGAIISTLADLKIWARAVTTGELIRIETLQERLQWITTGGGTGYPDLYGLGICTYFGLIGHTGGTFGYSSWMTSLPSQDATIIFFANGNSETTIGNLGRDVTDALYPDGRFDE